MRVYLIGRCHTQELREIRVLFKRYEGFGGSAFNVKYKGDILGDGILFYKISGKKVP